MVDWISRLAQRLVNLYCAPTIYDTIYDNDADARRTRGELDAMRARFRDHG